MSSKNLYVKNFCFKNNFSDKRLEDEFLENDGQIILLRLIDTINDYANQLNELAKVIGILKSWKEKDFYHKDIAYELNWFGCNRYDKNIKKVTLNQANKLYKETKIKYDTLYNLFKEASEIHYADNKEYIVENYFSKDEEI